MAWSAEELADGHQVGQRSAAHHLDGFRQAMSLERAKQLLRPMGCEDYAHDDA